MPTAAIPGPMRSAANRSKCSRDFQKSITPQPPSIGPETWKIIPSKGIAVRVDRRLEIVELHGGAAAQYLSMMPFSRAGLIEQLSSSAGEGFTNAEAVYGVTAVGL